MVYPVGKAERHTHTNKHTFLYQRFKQILFDLIVRVCAAAPNASKQREYAEHGCLKAPSIPNHT